MLAEGSGRYDPVREERKFLKEDSVGARVALQIRFQNVRDLAVRAGPGGDRIHRADLNAVNRVTDHSRLNSYERRAAVVALRRQAPFRTRADADPRSFPLLCAPGRRDQRRCRV
jgi:hypothetical protein